MQGFPIPLPVASTQALPIWHKSAAAVNDKRTSSRGAFNKFLEDEDLEVVNPDELKPPTGSLVPSCPTGASDEELKSKEYLASILSSTVYDVAHESTLEHAPSLYDKYGINIFLKREDRQSVFSFKLRGAYNMMSRLSSKDLENGVVCASAGNHAQGVALSASRLGCTAKICMPKTTPEIKVNAVKKIGGDFVTVILVGDTYDEASAEAKRLEKEEGLTYIPPFDHPDIIAGQGTVGLELARQMTRPTHAIFVPIGGGGLISGIATFMRQVYPHIKIIGVEPYEANSMAFAFYRKKRVTLDPVGKFVDGVAVATVGVENFRLSRELVDGVVLVSREYISAAIKDLYEENRMIVEPSGALAIAGARAYREFYNITDINVVAVLSGANMDFDQLKVIADLANIGSKREAVYATFFPEEQGSFRKFSELVGSLSITECKYRYHADKEKALVYYRVRYNLKPELEAMEDRMQSSQFQTVNLSDNDLVKDHLKHLVGNRAAIENEVLYRFVLPERAGAMKQFMDAFCPRWNITMFNYRAQGEISAHVLVGFQAPPNEIGEFHDCANKLGFQYQHETTNTSFQLLMQ